MANVGFRDDPRTAALVAGVVVLALLYSVFIAGRIGLWFGIVAVGGGAYVVWRFLRAVERIAAALERLADSTDRIDGTDGAVAGGET